MGRRLFTGLVTAASLAVTACGGGDDAGGSRTLNWYIAQQPGGALNMIAERCTQQSDGAYEINIEELPTQADQQREQLVRRLGAEDSAIDIVGMDVVWTGEFANAGWVQEVPAKYREDIAEGIFPSALETAKYEDKLYGAPIWSNTQLLWYRTDRVDEPPDTWDEMLAQAKRIGDTGDIQVQANSYEGLVVWANAMINSAGTSILSSPDEIALDREKTILALSKMAALGDSQAAPAGIDTSDEGSAAIGFESGGSSFMINYPFVYGSAEANAPEVFKNMGAAKYPRVDPDIESKPPLGGFNLGVSKFSENPDLAWQAVECLTSDESQVIVTKTEKIPPVTEALYDREEIRDVYPGFADLIRDSIKDAAPRPSSSPAYQDLSLAIQRALHPVTEMDPEKAYDKLKTRVRQAVEREGLL